MRYTPLPQELVEYITDYLKNDPHALRAASLVSRAFRSPSQRHIFSSIEITVSDEDCNHRLYDILHIHPEIARHVKKLKLLLIADNDIGAPGDVIVADEGILIIILRTLTSLRSLDFGSYWFGTAQWESYGVALRSAILHLLRLPSLEHVVASQITNFPCALAFEGCDFKTLKASYLNTSVDTAVQIFDMVRRPPASVKPWKVERLIMDSIPNMITPVLGSLFMPNMLPNITHLTALEVGAVSTDDGIYLCQRLLESSAMLEHLRLRVVEPCMGPWPKPIHLGSPLILRTLQLHVAGDPRQALPWIYEALSSIPPSNNLETIMLCLGDMIALTTLEEKEWSMIDSMIQNWDAPRLNLVHLSVHASGLEPDFSKFLATKVTNLFLGHIVSLSNNGARIYTHNQLQSCATLSIP